jgi:hypothetical protein
MDTDILTKTWIAIDDERKRMNKEARSRDEELKAKQDKIGAVLLAFLDLNNGESHRTKYGSFRRELDVVPVGIDWQELYDWIKDTDAFDALERRIKKTFLKEYMESHHGALPSGILSVNREYVLRITRPKKETNNGE